MLGAIAGAMISVTGLVFSITMVVVQLASSQFSPRVLEDFLSSRITQVTLGIFAASFTYALSVLRSVEGDSGEGGAFVPQVSVSVGFLLVLASVGMFLAFIHHITTSIQVSAIVSHLGDATESVIRRYLPEPGAAGAVREQRAFRPEEGWTGEVLLAEEHGAIVEVDHRSLVSWAQEHDAVVEVLHPVGTFLTEGVPAVTVWRREGEEELGQDELGTVRRRVVVEQDRFFNQDPMLGIRKLVDIAERALSSGVNDPTTAVQVLDEVHRLLRQVVTRADLPALVHADGELRLVHRPQRVVDLVDLALEEPLFYSTGSLQVPRRICVMLEDLLTVALPEHRVRLQYWLGVARGVVRSVEDQVTRPVAGAR